MALGRGYALPFVAGKQGAGGGGGAYGLLWQDAVNDNVPPLTIEDGNAGQGSCLFTRGKDLYDKQVSATPSLLIVPQIYGAGKLSVDIPSPEFFTVTRATTATRVNSSGLIESVASGVPRLDWYATPATQDLPATGCPALLVEAAGTNFARWVNQMTSQDTPTASGGMTITTGSIDFLAPDGTSGSITKYVGGAASGTSQGAYYSGGGIIFTASGQHTFSLFVKRGATNPLTFCALGFVNYTGGSGTSTSYFNLASGTALTAGASVEDYGNGWYRLISAPYTIASGDLNGQLIFWMAEGNGDISWPASGALNLTAYTWGAQVETGSVATTYIPTTTGAVSRAADSISASGALVSGLIGQTEGTLYVECESNNGSDDVFFINRSINNGISLYKNANNSYLGRIFHSSSSIIFTSVSGITGMVKIAVAYKSGDSTMYLNGSRVGTLNTSAITFSAALNSLVVEKTGFISGATPSSIRAVALYTTRLSDDQLAELTRL